MMVKEEGNKEWSTFDSIKAWKHKWRGCGFHELHQVGDYLIST
jgi:hypothetical protein